jgi:hypothetical protein
MNDTSAAPESTSDQKAERPGYSPYKLGAGVGTIVALASVFLLLTFVSIWANRQVLDSEQWQKTSTEILEQPAVQNALANYLVDQLFANVDVENEIKEQLPSDWEVLASPATSALRSITLSGTKKVLELPVTQEAWSAANAVAHQTLIDTLEGGRGGVSTEEGVVTVNARMVLQQAANKLGLSGNLVNKIPENAGTFEIWRSDDLATAQAAYKTFKNLLWVFAGLTIFLYALAIFLAKQRRRRATIAMGGSFVVVGLLVLIGVSLARGAFVDGLAQSNAVNAAVSEIYTIATELLRRMAGSIIFTGAVVLLGCLLTGPYVWAISTRRFLAPYLRDNLALSAAATALVYLIAIWLIPVSGLTTEVGLALNTLLVIAGFLALVSITRNEFPDAEPADFLAVGEWTRARYEQAKGFTQDVTARGSEKVQGLRSGEEKTTLVKAEHIDAADVTPTEPLTPAAPTQTDELERLQKLHREGSLTDEEFAAAKKRALGL